LVEQWRMRFSLFARATGGTRWLEKIAFGSRVGEGIGWTSAMSKEALIGVLYD
jgi:hypothetical protein